MSNQQWTPPSRSGGGGGSVRRARERMAAGLPSETPQRPQQRAYYDQARAAPSQPPQWQSQPQSQPQSQIPRPKPQMPTAGTRNAQAPVGVAISRPTQVPQWPLAGTIENVQDPRSNQQYQPPPGRSGPPQRPPRPSHVPSMLDASRLQDHTPSFQYKSQPQDQGQGRGQGRYQEDDDEYYVTSPMTQISRTSTVSSVGTIPDFPVPMPPPPTAGPRRSANLGPPPTARRGASSYYSQASYVSPIPEESPRSQPSHGSYASSAAIPDNWGSDSPGYDYYEDRFDDRDRGFGHETIEEGRESRESNDNDDTGLIRSASFGKRAKPSLITTRSSDRMEPQQKAVVAPQQKSKLERMGVVGAVAAAAGSAMTAGKFNNNNGSRETVWPMVGNPDSPLASGTGLIDKSTSSSEIEDPIAARSPITDNRSPPPLETVTLKDLRAQEMLGAYNAASSLSPGAVTPTRTPSPGFSRLSAIRRPPKLDIDAVRDAEARGSLTSLPDLIRRATRLAAMMDRGKRPASRMALDDFPSDRDKELDASPEEKRQSGLSGMLAAFPPPGLATPRDETPRPISTWPAGYDPSTPGTGEKRPKKNGRRCCGLPCWGAILLLLILLIIIAAAVVIPLEFLVLRKPKAAAAALTPIQTCQQNNATACQNGGNTFLTDGTCSCLCINGFTGSTCNIASATGCTTTTLTPDYPNVTLGDAIPRLITSAQTNFSIPLFSTTILARFNSANLSCLAENALVTFDGHAQRIGAANAVVVPTTTSSTTPPTTPPPRHRHRREESGLVIDTSNPPTAPVATPTSTPIYSSPIPSSTSSSAPSAEPTSTFVITETTLDFARIAILFILQQQNLDSAVAAQTSLQRFLSSANPTVEAAGNVTIGSANGGGNGGSVDLVGFRLDLGNGSLGSYNSSMGASRRMGRSIRLWDRS